MEAGKRGSRHNIVSKLDFNVYASAPMKEGETWTYASGGGERTVRNIEDILTRWLPFSLDKMNDENEKIIGIDTRSWKMRCKQRWIEAS